MKTKITNQSEDREVLQRTFANRFKSEIEKENFKRSAVNAAEDLGLGLLFLIIMGTVLILTTI